MNILGVYKNGNYNVTILSDGTKIRRTEEDEFIPEFPENADVKITDKCSQGCPFCFPEDTKIETNDGNKDIKNISIGDIVYSYNENKNKIELKPVEEIYKREYSGELICIELDNGNIIKCTSNHKIYTTNRGYIEAKDLLESDDILIYK